ATVVARGVTQARPETVVRQETEPLVLAHLVAANLAVVDLLLRDTPAARASLFTKVVNLVRVQDRRIKLAIPERDIVPLKPRVLRTDRVRREDVRVRQVALNATVDSLLGDVRLDLVLDQLVNHLHA